MRDYRLEEEQKIVRLREALGIPDDLQPDPIDLLRRATYVGIISGFRQVPDVQLGDALAHWDDEKREITFSANIPPAEFAFTICHELGHAVLKHRPRHRRTGGNVQHGRFIERDEEAADLFARAFMSPTNLAMIDQQSTVQALSAFGLPETQKSLRLEELKRLHRRQNRLARQIPVPKEGEQDTYELAMKEMHINTVKWNS